MSEANACLACGAERDAPAWPDLAGCRRCGLMSVIDIPSAEALTSLYGDRYFHGDEYADYLREEPHLRSNFRARLRTLVRHAAARNRLLEVGCAYGFFFDEAHAAYERVVGIDVAAHAVAHARTHVGVKAHAGDYLAFDPGAPQDAVVMWDTIEHLGEPDAVIRKAARDLHPGGLLAFTTGDAASVVARLRGPAWRLYHPPTHLHYFTPRSVHALLPRVGIDVVSITYPAITRSLAWVAESVAPWGARWWRSLPTRMGIPLALRDVMMVVGRKR